MISKNGDGAKRDPRRWKSDCDRDENCRMSILSQNSWPEQTTRSISEKPRPKVWTKDAVEQQKVCRKESSGWGLNILRQHQKQSTEQGTSKKQDYGVSQRRVPKGSFVDLIPGGTQLTLRDEDERSGRESDSVTSSGLSSSNNSTQQRVSTSGSSGCSSGDIDASFEDIEAQAAEQHHHQVSVGRRGEYKQGLSQRRIRGSCSSSSSSGGGNEKEPIAVQETLCSSATTGTATTDVDQVQGSQVEQLFLAVKTKDEATVKSLYSEGVSLESLDKYGMTPLIVACLDGSLLNMARTLIELGANVNAYRSGLHAGYPLHHAAKRGHGHAVQLLLSSGAEALAVNDDGQTALDIARVRGHASVVRVIEDWISLFKGILRQVTDNAGSQIMKRTWAVVLPSESSPGLISRRELVVYNSRKVPMPESVILLGSVTSDFEEPNYSLSDPSFIITDRVTKTKFKFFSHEHGDRKQLAEFYRACKGMSQEKSKIQRSLTLQARATGAESIQNRRSCDYPHSSAALASASSTSSSSNDLHHQKSEGGPPAIVPQRFRTDKPNSRKNLIFPEESLNTDFRRIGEQQLQHAESCVCPVSK